MATQSELLDAQIKLYEAQTKYYESKTKLNNIYASNEQQLQQKFTELMNYDCEEKRLHVKLLQIDAGELARP